MNLFLIERQTFKIFFEVSVSKEDAAKIVKSYDPTMEMHNFYSKEEIGCNTITFAIVTSTLEKMREVNKDSYVVKFEVIPTFYKQGTKECNEGGGCCSPKG